MPWEPLIDESCAAVLIVRSDASIAMAAVEPSSSKQTILSALAGVLVQVCALAYTVPASIATARTSAPMRDAAGLRIRPTCMVFDFAAICAQHASGSPLVIAYVFATRMQAPRSRVPANKTCKCNQKIVKCAPNYEDQVGVFHEFMALPQPLPATTYPSFMHRGQSLAGQPSCPGHRTRSTND